MRFTPGTPRTQHHTSSQLHFLIDLSLFSLFFFFPATEIPMIISNSFPG
ncbi:hypothetical protein CP10139811_1074 [Chlamydia ibidis]|uniref:Uncharacterized protein n=1 Tax=Chlamydia ibidis TaxID=1405396 RepID=S7J4D8_9CHLA